MIQYISGNFITSRSDMEVVNGVAGVLLGLMIFIPGITIAESSSFVGLLEMVAVEWFWGVVFLVMGGMTFLAWGCKNLICRQWMMLFGSAVWLLLFATLLSGSLIGGKPITIGSALFVALGAGSAVAFKRMQRATTVRNR